MAARYPKTASLATPVKTAARTEARPAAAPARENASKRNNASEQQIQSRIRERAYQLFVKRGRAHGFDRQDWLEAERQVRKELQNS